MCSATPKDPTVIQPGYVHNPFLDGGPFGQSVDANRIGTSALTIGLDPQASAGVSGVPAQVKQQNQVTTPAPST